MAFKNVPRDIEEIFDMRGAYWTEDQKEKVLIWLYGQPQIRNLLCEIADCLDTDSMVEDAEDMLSTFVSKHLAGVIRNYDPDKGRFSALFFTSLRRECHREGKRISRRRSAEQSLTLSPDEEDELGPLEMADTNAVNPEQAAIGKEFLAALNHALVSLGNPQHHRVFVEIEIHGYSVEEVARMTNAKRNTVRQWHRRAKQNIRTLLAARGWEMYA